MSASRYCSQCGKALRHDDGEIGCPNGHVQEDHDRLTMAFTELVPIMVELRERFRQMDERTDEQLEALREEVSVLAAVVTPPQDRPANVGMEEICRQLGVSRDWMYRDDRRRKLGGYQEGKGARWRFDPDRTRALFVSLYGASSGESPPTSAAPARPRQLPAKVPLLPVEGSQAA
jgi:uncharacterized Zn finger protein (UPF0148 family)